MKTVHPKVRQRFQNFFQLSTNRPLYADGPIVHVVVLLIVVTSLLSVAAFTFALVNYSNRLDDIQASRLQSAADTCRTLRTVIDQAYRPQQGGKVVVPAILGKRHSVVTLTRNGMSTTYSSAASQTKVTLTVIEPKRPDSAAKQIAADGLANCSAHAHKQVSLNR